ncbi:AAA family ATPase [Paenibacillus sp. PsM32]|uniref:AAA family ATPase n=1 Tax=Paenibacillus kyungheensis TaxID=1452732 RepID=A0AAX3LX92_9BACL|nr:MULTISPECIES: AAA family ATPase [Paenibacillus]MDN4617977.1 AAA family ATPase [Paenibacillus sp. PsM32]MDQ1234698.1 cell division protease FtsH [Paenibacillus sp. SORGH_AS_0306]MDR6111743.1 cell division protease FtsH [Paenibacillus sp. SORGH_AS_0338]WCT54292.1 AAA family ATPase [Paenibacillus kyungheensis]WDF52578.1 AAA family ATPase [Paenibacillus sp. KACC 21273]
MPKWTKEIVVGFVPVLLIFLIFVGYNILPLLLIAALVGGTFLVMQMRGGLAVGAAQERKRKKNGPLKLTFEQIGGQDNAKRELREALDFLVRHDEMNKFGIRPLKGILLTGPPGTGKTLMAKAAAHYTDSVFVSASGSEFVEMYVGVGAGRIRDLFKDARTRAAKENKQSAIIFIDEIDVIGGKREGGQQREYDQTLNQLLTEMDGIYSNEAPRILIIAATNRKEMLDSALLRPGRFDRHIQVDLPDKKGRKHILELHAANKPLAKETDLDKLAEEAYGFSGAQLESVMNEGAIYAMRQNADHILQSHLSMAIDKVMMGEKTDRESSIEEKRRVAIHELGHAIMAEVVRPGSVGQVALSPRGQALGYVRHNPAQEQYLYTKPFLEEQIMIALGGAAAEEMYYEGRSTGSRGDFDQALNIVQTMMESGLTKLGIVSMNMVPKEQIMKENNAILEDLTRRTKEILDSRRLIFDTSLDILLKEEVLSGEQFRQQFNKSSNVPA